MRAWIRTSGAAALFGGWLLLALIPASGCGDDCVEGVSTDCSALYEPTFDNVFSNTLQPTCGAAGSSCHAAEGASGGLVFSEVEASYEALVNGGLVVAGDAACGELVSRLASTGSDGMPPGSPLSATERCSILQWIANGASR